MQDMKFDLLTTDKNPHLKIRYYKSSEPHKGIIIFVHGVSHGAWCWENFVKFFTKIGYACFAINLRGHGDDRDHKKGRLSKYVDDVKQCVDYCESFCKKKDNNLPYSKPFIIGHSMGGAIVEIYISDFSDKVSGAVLFAPATAQGMGISILTTTATTTGCHTMPTTLGFKTNKHLAKSNFFVAKDHNKNFVPRITDQKKLEYYDKQLCPESTCAMLGLIKFRINNVHIPVFVIGSDKDAYFPEDSLISTANFYNTKPMILRGLCHDMMLDPEWERAAQSVLAFIEKPSGLQKDPQKFIENLEKKIYPN